MVSICAQDDNSNYDSNDLASSDVFVKLSQHTSVEMSDFTVFVLVFLSYYLHLQSLKYHVSEMILGSQSIVKDSIAAQSRSNVATKLQQSKTFDISLAKIYTTLTNEEKLHSTKLFGQDVPTFKILIPLTIAAVIFIVFLSLTTRGPTAPVWPSQLGGENLVIIGMVTAVASLGLSYFVLTVETPALMWIVLVSIAFAVYAVVKTSNCDPNKVFLYKPDGYGDNFLDFNPLWILLAFAMFVIQKIVFSLLLSRRGSSFRILRGISFMFFLLFYAFMIMTTFHSSPETKHHQYIPCTSKGSFVGQLIYWPLFLIIVFYIERGSYTFKDEIDVPTFGAAIITYIISALLFIVPISTILGWEGNQKKKETISLDTPDSRCCKTQKLSSSSLRTFDIHYNNLPNESMTFELLKIVDGREVLLPGKITNIDQGKYALLLVKGDKSDVTISKGETLGQFQIALKAGELAFGPSETEADYILRITFQDQSRLSSITHDQSFQFLRTDRVERYSLPDEMPDGNPMPSGTTVRDDGVVMIGNRPLMSDGNPMDENHTIRNDNVILDTAGNPVQSQGQNLQVVLGTAVVINQDPSETEKVVGCTSRNEPISINLRGNLEMNNFTPGSGINPISFTGRHANTGPGMGAFWGFWVGTALSSTYLGITNATSNNGFGVAGLLTGIVAGFLYGGIVGAPSGAISGAILEKVGKGRQMRFEYLDENNYPVARIAADDEADISLQKVPLKRHTAHEWRHCSQSSQTATSSVDNENCNGTNPPDPPPIEYTPPEHCKYLADFKIDFSNYPDTTVEGGAYYGLKFNANTEGSTKVYIHFHQDKANDPIFGTEGYMYWLIFAAFLIVFTFLMQAGLSLFGKEQFLPKRLQKTTEFVSKGTEGVAQTAEHLRNFVRGTLGSTATGAVSTPTLMTSSTPLRAGVGVVKKRAAKVAKGAVDMTSAVAGGLKKGTGFVVGGLGDGFRAGGKGLYDRTIKPLVKAKDLSLLSPRTSP